MHPTRPGPCSSVHPRVLRGCCGHYLPSVPRGPAASGARGRAGTKPGFFTAVLKMPQARPLHVCPCSAHRVQGYSGNPAAARGACGGLSLHAEPGTCTHTAVYTHRRAHSRVLMHKHAHTHTPWAWPERGRHAGDDPVVGVAAAGAPPGQTGLTQAFKAWYLGCTKGDKAEAAQFGAGTAEGCGTGSPKGTELLSPLRSLARPASSRQQRSQ